EPYAVKVARTVLRGAALGNKCRLLDRGVLKLIVANTPLPQCDLHIGGKPITLSLVICFTNYVSN
ncbi:hypothetical protein ACP3VT_17850, partial [Vibrio sp. PNB23_22_7]